MFSMCGIFKLCCVLCRMHDCRPRALFYLGYAASVHFKVYVIPMTQRWAQEKRLGY